MRKIKLYIAASVNSIIASKDGSVDWLEKLPKPENSDYGYADFCQSVDSTIMGYNTYKQIMDWDIDFPYPDKTNYVLTRKKDITNTEYAQFISENPIDFISSLKSQKGNDIWLIGGGQINTLLLNAGLVDEIQLFQMPVILSEGIHIFENIPRETNLQLFETKTYSTGCIELKYKLNT